MEFNYRFFLYLVALFYCPLNVFGQIRATSVEPTTFFVLGDWGYKGGEKQMAVANQMIKQSRIYHPSMIFTVGDNFYENGVTDVTDEHWQLSFKKPYKDLTKLPWYVTLGNHDYRGNVDAQIDYHKVDSHWHLPARYYTFVQGTTIGQKVRFVIIDTDPYVSTYYTDPMYSKAVRTQDTARQTHWLDSVLASAKEPWKIVIGHHPLYSASPREGEAEVLAATMGPIFEKYHVQAYICGHDHLMQYNRPPRSHVAYIISGAGGKPNNRTNKVGYTIFNSNTAAFMVGSISGRQFKFCFIDATGKKVFEDQIAREVY